jgi:hypothetical protein
MKPTQRTTKRPEQPQPVRFISRYPSICYPLAPHGAIRFTDGAYETSDAAEIDYLDQTTTCERA